MSKRAILYARVSGDDRGKEDRNLKGQLEMCRQYAQERDYTVVDELTEDDRGASGAAFDLPELNKALDLAQASEFDVLVTRELDRFARGLAKQLIVEGEFNHAGVEVEYILGEYPDTPEGRLNKHIKAVIAEYEREKIAERTTRARRLKVRAGHVVIHGRPPYGYRVGEVDGKTTLVIHEPEARIVRLIFQWYTADEPSSARAIADRLTGMEISKPRSRKHAQWTHSTVNNILKNEVYTGRWYYGRNVIVNGQPVKQAEDDWLMLNVPAIVTEIFGAAKERRQRNKERAHRQPRHSYLLSGRVRCWHCNYSYTGSVRTSPNREYLYYVHSPDHYAAGTLTCKGYFRADQVDALVWEWIRSRMCDPEELVRGLQTEQEERERENAPLRDRLAVISDLIANNRRQLDRLLDLYLASDFPKEMLTERKARLETTIASLEREQTTLTEKIEAQILTDDQIRNIREYAEQVTEGIELANADFEARRWLVGLLNVQARLEIEDGVKKVHVSAVLGDTVLEVVSSDSTPSAPIRKLAI